MGRRDTTETNTTHADGSKHTMLHHNDGIVHIKTDAKTGKTQVQHEKIPLSVKKAKHDAAVAAATAGHRSHEVEHISGHGYFFTRFRPVHPDGSTSDKEWKTLTTNLGGKEINNLIPLAGGKMKEVGTTHWNAPNTNATNLSGFKGLPGGNRGSDGNDYFLNGYGNWWSSTLNAPNNPWSRALAYNNAIVGINDLDSNYGFSIRCIKD
jgi:uncharacterized protein (TIGR02145 family)